jgi:hypothetical protein
MTRTHSQGFRSSGGGVRACVGWRRHRWPQIGSKSRRFSSSTTPRTTIWAFTSPSMANTGRRSLSPTQWEHTIFQVEGKGPYAQLGPYRVVLRGRGTVAR